MTMMRVLSKHGSINVNRRFIGPHRALDLEFGFWPGLATVTRNRERHMKLLLRMAFWLGIVLLYLPSLDFHGTRKA
jgi:hypothetical protein